MINVMENKVLGPLILKRCEEAEQVGRGQGLPQGRLDLLREQLTAKFGSLLPWATQRLEAASADVFAHPPSHDSNYFPSGAFRFNSSKKCS